MDVPPMMSMDLRCDSCGNYLSVKPIVYDLYRRYFCGRLECIPKHKNTSRAKQYEALASLMRFPCMNDAFGCTAKVNISTEAHELQCNFQTVACPAEDCMERILLEGWKTNLVGHYEARHETCVVKTPKSLYFSQKVTENKKLLMELDERLFLLHIKLKKAKQCRLRLEYLRPDDSLDLSLDEIHYKIAVNSVGKPRATRANLTYYGKFEGQMGEWHLFDYDVLKTALKARSFLYGISLVSDDGSGELRKDRECLVCEELIFGYNVYQCTTGHRLCFNCGDGRSTCSICSESIEKSISYF